MHGGPGGHDMHGGPGGPGGPHRGPMGPQGMRQGPGRVLDELGLDAATRTKVEAIFKGIHEAMRPLHEKAKQGAMSHDDVRAEHEKLRAAAEEQLKTILSPEQFEKLKDAMGPRGPRPEQVPGQGPGAK